MEMKLIKLSDTHYIVVDDSEIREGDFVFQQNFERTNNQIIRIETEFQAKIANDKDGSFTKRKITHSTQPLEEMNHGNYKSKVFLDIKPLPLSEVEEVIYGYSVEKMAFETTKHLAFPEERRLGYELGFNAHKELMKDKFILSKEELTELLVKSITSDIDFIPDRIEQIIQSLLPKTERLVTFDKQSKLKLI